LLNLQKRAESATNLKEWAIARLQAAIYMARTSRIDEAGGVAEDIRSRFRGNEEAEVYIWLWILGGVLGYYQTGLTGCRPILTRALLVSKGLRRHDLFEYASAWSAHLNYVAGDYEVMVNALVDARLDRASIAEAACRASLTAAGSWQLCGEIEVAAKWFARARDIARSIGDRASIMASIENRALVWLDRVWVESCYKMPGSNILNQIEMELRSGLSYEQITSSLSLIEQGPVARLRLLVLRQNFAAALKMIGELNFDPAKSDLSNLRVIPVIELWLRVEMGLVDRVDLDTISGIESRLVGIDDDDAAVCYRYLSMIAARFDYRAQSNGFAHESGLALDRFRCQVTGLRRELERYPDFASPFGMVRPVKS
jgi:hypothetical protein